MTALTHPAMMSLLERKVIQLDLFDEKNFAEVKVPDNPAIRYILCKTPVMHARETIPRKARIACMTNKQEELVTTNKKPED